MDFTLQIQFHFEDAIACVITKYLFDNLQQCFYLFLSSCLTDFWGQRLSLSCQHSDVLLPPQSQAVYRYHCRFQSITDSYNIQICLCLTDFVNNFDLISCYRFAEPFPPITSHIDVFEQCTYYTHCILYSLGPCGQGLPGPRVNGLVAH